MSKLFKLKEWLTVPDAAKHLTNMFGEDVTVADVLMLAIDGHLRLSIRCINPVKLLRGQIVPVQVAKRKPMSPKVMAAIEDMASFKHGAATKFKESPMVFCGAEINRENVFESCGTPEYLRGVFDLLLIGDDRLAVEDKHLKAMAAGEVDYLADLGRHGIDWNFMSQSVLEDAAGNHYMFENSGDTDYWIATGDPLPKDAMLVVRTEALREFEQSLANEQGARVEAKKPPTDNKLIETIAALLAAWPQGKPPTGKDLEKAAASVGVSVSDDTIRSALRAARDIAPGLPSPNRQTDLPK
jgi:hypothetical protein